MVLVLLERVFLRLGSAGTDDQLENVLSKFLVPVLLKLSSPEETVRKKVMLSHLYLPVIWLRFVGDGIADSCK